MVIAHLYKDLLNLYGNDGNVKILKNKLEQLGCEVTVEEPSLGDKMDFGKYDLVFIGSGTEDNQKMAIEDIRKHRSDIEKAIEEGKVFIVMGNSLDMFGEKLVGVDGTGESMEALGIFSFNSIWTDRIRKDIRRQSIFTGSELLGFENHNYIAKGSDVSENGEIRRNNFFGAYVEGPVLVRNPELCRTVIELLAGSKADKLDMDLEEMAYKNFIKIFDECNVQ